MKQSSPSLSRFGEVVLDFFFPRRCVGCGQIGSFICPNCWRTLPKLVPPFCPKCGKPQPSGLLCASCWRKPSKIDSIRSTSPFEGVMRQAIHELKYHNLKAISVTLAQLLVSYLETNSLSVEVVVPVPLHPKRLRERGYNQSSLLARELSKQSGLPLVEDCLYRFKNSPPQAETNTAEERWKNVAGAFECHNDKLRGKRVLLIDDVCTSGATLEACAEVLKDGGVAMVWGLTLAREI